MLPEPLHPAVVHFPIVLAVLLPIFALWGLWAIRGGVAPRRAWALTVALTAVLTLSAWAAVETGENEEDRVEAVVGEEVLHEHEEAGERFLLLSGILLLVSAGGLFGGTLGAAARYVATLGAFGVVIAGVQVGEAGGELVYRHDAGSAYDTPASPMGATAPAVIPDGEDNDEKDDHR